MVKLIVVFMISCCLIGGCSQQQQSNERISSLTSEETKIYIIPKAYFDYTRSEVAESVKSMLDLGDQFCTDAKEIPEGMQLELTNKQLNNFVRRNNEFMDRIKESFLSASSLYKCVVDESNNQLTLYCDEKNPTALAYVMTGMTNGLWLNYMLLNNTTHYNLKLEIRNCHTNKLVVSMNFPVDKEVSFGAEEWDRSYN